MKFVRTIAITAAAMLLPTLAHAGCSGNACADAVLTKRNGCMVIINNGDRPFKFSHGAGHSPIVYPQSSEIIRAMDNMFKVSNRCMRSLGRNWTANYVN